MFSAVLPASATVEPLEFCVVDAANAVVEDTAVTVSAANRQAIILFMFVVFIIYRSFVNRCCKLLCINNSPKA